MMSSNLKIIISGSIAIDRIMNFKGKYKDQIKKDKLHVLSLSVLLNDLKNTHGGVGANISYNLALLGEKPILIGSVGHDAKDYINKLSSLNIDTTNIHFSALNTASFNVITDLDDNQVGGFYPGAMSDNNTSSFQKYKAETAIFVVSPDDPSLMNKLVSECKENNLRLFYDFGQQVSNSPPEHLLAGIKAAEIIIANDYEMSVLSDKIGLTIDQIKQTVPVCITTLGEKGSTIEGKSVPIPLCIKAAKPKQVLDPTGAGDAYRAGFLFGFCHGLDLQTCGQIGSITAIYAVETQGTQEHTFTLEEFKTRYLKNFNEQLQINN